MWRRINTYESFGLLVERQTLTGYVCWVVWDQDGNRLHTHEETR